MPALEQTYLSLDTQDTDLLLSSHGNVSAGKRRHGRGSSCVRALSSHYCASTPSSSSSSNTSTKEPHPYSTTNRSAKMSRIPCWVAGMPNAMICL